MTRNLVGTSKIMRRKMHLYRMEEQQRHQRLTTITYV